MAIRRNAALRDVSLLVRAGNVAELTDGQLLDRFNARRGEGASELAFTALVGRHGPMVLRVCRAVVGDSQDAHDAFQATFLVLVRKAGALQTDRPLAPWLRGVAYRVAMHARSDAARRRQLERRAAEVAPARAEPDAKRDLEAAVHEEVDRLPARYRDAVVLCDLSGLTLEQASRQLGCPVGTVKSRLARGRERLRGPLARRGFGPSVGAAGWLAFDAAATAAVPSALHAATTRFGLRLAASRPAAGVASASVAALTQGVLQAMWLTRLKTTAAALLALGLLSLGVGTLAQHGDPAPAAPDRAGAKGDDAPSPTTRPLIDGLLSRSTAVTSGHFEYHLKVEIAGRTERDADLRFDVSGDDWAVRDVGTKNAVVNHDGRLLRYTETRQEDGTVHRSLTVDAPESPFKNPPYPPARAGTLWYASTRRFVRERAGSARRLEAASVNGVETQPLEWDVAPGDAYSAFESINAMLAGGGKLRLYVAPRLGNALPRVEYVDRFGTVQSRFDSHVFKEVAPGVFLPTSYRIDQGTYKESCELTMIDRVNRPVPPSAFVLPIPPGTSVEDVRPKRKDAVGPDGARTFRLDDYPYRQFRTGAAYPQGFPAELLKELDRDVIVAAPSKTP